MGGKSPSPPPPTSNNRAHTAEEKAAADERARIAAKYPHRPTGPTGELLDTEEDALGSGTTTILGT